MDAGGRTKLMLKAPILAAVPLILAVLSCVAQTSDPQRSGGMLNGRVWKGMNASQRLYFLVGYSEHLNLAEATGCKGDPDIRFPALPVNFGETVKGLDRIYDAPENAGVGIIWALDAFTLQVTGADEAKIADRLRIGRQIANQPAAAQQPGGVR